jgi:hypothetical protein
MDEQKTTNDNTSGASAGKPCMCGCGASLGYPGFRRHRVIRIVIALVIAIIIFWVGVKVGEFKTVFESHFRGGYGSHQMMRGGYYGGGHMMMPGQAVPVSGTATSSAATPVQ